MKKITVDLTKDIIKREKFLESLKSAIKYINSTGVKIHVVKENKSRAK